MRNKNKCQINIANVKKHNEDNKTVTKSALTHQKQTNYHMNKQSTEITNRNRNVNY